MKPLFALFFAAFVAVTPSLAQRPANDPGYVDPVAIEQILQSEATLEVNLGGSMLRLVVEATRDEDRDLHDLLSKIRGIYVRGYTLVGEEARTVGARFSQVAQRLVDNGWERIVRVRDGDETVHVLVRAREDRIDGLSVLVSAPGENETVFVNIVGEIRPEEIGRIGRRFNIGALEDL